MSILKALRTVEVFFERRKFARAEADAEKIGSLIAPFINATGQAALHDLKRCIPYWSLSNEALRKYLGYVAGVIDAGQQCGLGKTSTDDWTATELVFHQVIGAQLDWIPGCDSFLEVNRLGLEVGGTAIGGMQRLPDFNEAMKLGANDFLSVGSPGFFPRGLHELGLFLSVQDGAERNGNKRVVPNESLSEKNIFDRSQDRALSDVEFFRKECLRAVYGHCIVKDRNIRASDSVIVGPRFINCKDGSDDSISDVSPDEIKVDCSEPIIARCLTAKSEIDFDNCAAVADNVAKFLIFSRGVECAKVLFQLIRLENLSDWHLLAEQEMKDYLSANHELKQRALKVMASAKSIDMQTVERIEAEGWQVGCDRNDL